MITLRSALMDSIVVIAAPAVLTVHVALLPCADDDALAFRDIIPAGQEDEWSVLCQAAEGDYDTYVLAHVPPVI